MSSDELSHDAEVVLRCINAAAETSNDALTAMEIAELIDMPLERVAFALNELEMCGAIVGEERNIQ